jgi:hypothetical protein
MDFVLPTLRDPSWPGWRGVFVRDVPCFEPSAWAPRLGYVVPTHAGPQLLTEADVHGAGLDHVHRAALHHLTRMPAAWQPKLQASGFMGITKKPQILEHVDDFASERLLLSPFIEHATTTLEKNVHGMTTSCFYAPVRGTLWAAPARVFMAPGAPVTEHPYDAALRGEAEQLRMAGREPLCGSAPLTPFHVILEGESVVGFEILGPAPRTYVPLLSSLALCVTTAGEPDLYPHDRSRALSDGPFGLGLAVGVQGIFKFHALRDDSLQALELDAAGAEAIAWRNLGPAGSIKTFGDRVVGYREPHAALRVADEEALRRLHQALGASRLAIAVVSQRLLVARPAPVDNQSFILEAMDYLEDPLPPGQPRGYVGTPGRSLSPVAHVVENGRLILSPSPNSFDAGVIGADIAEPSAPPIDDYQRALVSYLRDAGPAHWHRIGVEFTPDHPDRALELFADLRRLEAMGLAESENQGQQWSVTALGRSAVVAPRAPVVAAVEPPSRTQRIHHIGATLHRMVIQVPASSQWQDTGLQPDVLGMRALIGTFSGNFAWEASVREGVRTVPVVHLRHVPDAAFTTRDRAFTYEVTPGSVPAIVPPLTEVRFVPNEWLRFPNLAGRIEARIAGAEGPDSVSRVAGTLRLELVASIAGEGDAPLRGPLDHVGLVVGADDFPPLPPLPPLEEPLAWAAFE